MEEVLLSENTQIEREKAMTLLYQNCFTPAAKYISKMGGSFEEAKDIFHDALIIYYEKHFLSEQNTVKQEKAYLLGITKHLWSKRFAEKKHLSNLKPEYENNFTDITEAFVTKEKLLQFLSTSGKKCMELLQAFYYDKLPLEQIAERFGFSGIRSATSQKFKCLTKVRETIKEKSLNYEDFLD